MSPPRLSVSLSNFFASGTSSAATTRAKAARSSLRHVVGSAANGAQALELAGTLDRLDVVLMDLSMPGLDGVAATAAICEANPGVAVVVLTSFSEPSRIHAALEAGAIGYQLKDAAPDDLIAAVRAASSKLCVPTMLCGTI